MVPEIPVKEIDKSAVGSLSQWQLTRLRFAMRRLAVVSLYALVVL